MNGLSISLDSQTVTAELWTSDVDAGSYHSCGSSNPIKIGFDAFTTQIGVVFGCSHAGEQFINLYVRDTQAGINYFCTSRIEVQDPFGVCGGMMEVAIVSGEIYTVCRR